MAKRRELIAELIEELEEPTPDEEDAFFSSSGSLGSKTSVSIGGKFLGEFSEQSEAEEVLREYMNKSQYWPNIWMVSDHGNYHLITLEEPNE